MRPSISRRKFVAISAAAGGLGLIPFSAAGRASDAPLVEWEGLMLGAVATLKLYHPDRAAGEHLVARAVAEAQRLETIFSLYETDSVLSELNRRGAMAAPPAELVDVLGLCDRIWRLSDGVFDPTVQPLWRAYAAHFTDGGRTAPLSAAELADALQFVGWSKVRYGRDLIALAKPGVALTLNGIAQGYITDRVVDLLRKAGIGSSLVDMGEIRTLGARPDGRPWQAALRGPADDMPAALDVVDKAVATSAASGFAFDATGTCNHLFNPATGRCADPARALTVVADTAAEADALSTAFALMDDAAIRRVLAAVPGTRAYVTTDRGTREIARAPA